MILCDVNVLLYAYREDTEDHKEYLAWLNKVVNSKQAYGVSDHVLSSVIRIATHPKIFNPPSSLSDVLKFILQIRNKSNAVAIKAGQRHWGIFQDLLLKSNAKGNLVPDAYFAALAIENGCTWVTTDRDFSRFEGLDWRHPFR